MNERIEGIPEKIIPLLPYTQTEMFEQLFVHRCYCGEDPAFDVFLEQCLEWIKTIGPDTLVMIVVEEFGQISMQKATLRTQSSQSVLIPED